jgi:hypothetical protein
MTGERTIQALLQALVMAVVGAIAMLITFVATPEFRGIVEGETGLLAPIILDALLALLTFIKKWLGGVTFQPPASADGVRAGVGRDRPNLLAL